MNNKYYIKHSHNFSFIIAKILNRMPWQRTLARKYNSARHQLIMRELNPLFTYTLSEVERSSKKKNKNSNKIWFFWWQGQDKLTDLSRKCYESILKNRGKRDVIFISKLNIKKYATLPNYVYEKVDKGQITLTHLSDLIRFNLLSNYGGLWMDATLYVTGNLDNIDTEQLFTCSGYEDKTNFNVSQGRWTGFLIGGPSHLDIFEFMNVFFKEYWKYNDKLVDYFLIDYALNYALSQNMSNFSKITKRYSKFEPNLFSLQKCLNKKFEVKKWKVISHNTNIFKLTNKKQISHDADNFYSNLL
ncbi:capsular polysaccharide synthesis protein [Lactobacillus helveticus]|uniref:capsular polysaccharide synthesis protein n=1 Tax=Lactobacillus helveticus TaxID=1587 RepID=UPI0013FE0EEC|nr:capsular polysaccharide synthesis protein [Lactobacillus helveticus]NHL85289.1 capsular polysaccharide synthesis family protein [Lactobacillus helveticus]